MKPWMTKPANNEELPCSPEHRPTTRLTLSARSCSYPPPTPRPSRGRREHKASAYGAHRCLRRPPQTAPLLGMRSDGRLGPLVADLFRGIPRHKDERDDDKSVTITFPDLPTTSTLGWCCAIEGRVRRRLSRRAAARCYGRRAQALWANLRIFACIDGLRYGNGSRVPTLVGSSKSKIANKSQQLVQCPMVAAAALRWPWEIG